MNQIFEKKEIKQKTHIYNNTSKIHKNTKIRSIIYKQKTSTTKINKLINNMPKQNNLRQNKYKNAIEFNFLLSIYC